jgi:hypothetical protein
LQTEHPDGALRFGREGAERYTGADRAEESTDDDDGDDDDDDDEAEDEEDEDDEDDEEDEDETVARVRLGEVLPLVTASSLLSAFSSLPSGNIGLDDVDGAGEGV